MRLALPLQDARAAARIADDRFGGHTDEEAMLDDSDNLIEAARQVGRGTHVGPEAIEDIVSAVGGEAFAENRRGADGAEAGGGGLPAEGDDFDGDGTVGGGETVDDFGFV